VIDELMDICTKATLYMKHRDTLMKNNLVATRVGIAIITKPYIHP
jgi:hypothetical protein